MSGKADIISQLQRDILRLQGFRSAQRDHSPVIDLGQVNSVFPDQTFPVGTIHEFLCPVTEHAAAASGFVSALTGTLMQYGGACIWISVARTLFPPSLKTFGIEPDKVIFIDLQRTKDALWALEEALKCEGLAAVVAEIPEIGFTQSRRLQLAVEQSRVTGFILRTSSRPVSATACAARWQITSLPSGIEDNMPGVGYPRWQVELLKVRNGRTGSWKMEWSESRFTVLVDQPVSLNIPDHQLKTG
ncbi:ImuA family protein [Chitinophaga rhizophila]|uniref:Error-prone repair protein ImuA n=1 Tax=Chitinophaga rhizophila TaxID=2866212 RepID=A0ABS7GJH3_9BACT|nr:Error-prone repair protein ImuA [Chitinophaga rhizophila]MBW8687863.1 Error-prone repair protein ImuA [Chitinophaga rhizophila]